MGCFSASCSISSVTIESGDPVVFFPLVASKYEPKDGRFNLPGHMLTYPNAILGPLCLPIFGNYDDYGSIENVQKNANTEAIETFFGITIEEFIDCVTCGRSPLDAYSGVFKTFAIHKDPIADYKVKFGQTWLESLEFVKLSNTGISYFDYALADLPYIIELTGNYKHDDTAYKPGFLQNYSYRIIDSDGIIIVDRTSRDDYSCQHDFLKDFLKLTGYYINYRSEDQWKIKRFANISGMFVHRDIYTYISVEDDETEQYVKQYDIFREKLLEHKAKVDAGFTNPEELWLAGLKDPLGCFGFENDIKRFHEDMPYFAEMYRTALVLDSLRNEFLEYNNFYWAMYSSNRFWFPGMCGEQHGNTEVSLRLAKATYELLKIRREEEEIENAGWE